MPSTAHNKTHTLSQQTQFLSSNNKWQKLHHHCQFFANWFSGEFMNDSWSLLENIVWYITFEQISYDHMLWRFLNKVLMSNIYFWIFHSCIFFSALWMCWSAGRLHLWLGSESGWWRGKRLDQRFPRLQLRCYRWELLQDWGRTAIDYLLGQPRDKDKEPQTSQTFFPFFLVWSYCLKSHLLTLFCMPKSYTPLCTLTKPQTTNEN